MTTYHKITTAIICAILSVFLTFEGHAAKHQTISSADGLSNNALLCLHQDKLGHIYIGTADGLNIWDGVSMKTFQAADGRNYFFGNMIRHIFPHGEHILYLQTNYGVARLDTRTAEIEFYEELAFFSRLVVAEDGNIIAMDKNNVLYYFDIQTRELSLIKNTFIPERERCRRITLCKDGRLCVFTNKDIYIISLAATSETGLSISEISNLGKNCRHVSPSYDGTNHYVITPDYRLYIFNKEDCSLTELTVIRNLPPSNISCILPVEDGYFLSFWQHGLYFLPKGEQVLQKTDVEYGIFSMIPDKRQPIIWVGTDGNGLIKYNMESNSISCLTYDELPHSVKMPIRSILVDNDRSLWLGTKGDGLLRIPDFDKGLEIRYDDCQKFSTDNSMLNNNSVYALTASRHDMVWIGTDGDGLNVWINSSKQIRNVPGSEKIRMIHSIIEQDESTLWVSTDGCGAYRCTYEIRNGAPQITDLQQIKFSEPFNDRTNIFSMTMENDSTLWFGSRGFGVLTYNMNTGKSKVIQFPTDNGYAINETFYITKSDQILIATGNGLVAYSQEDSEFRLSEFVPQKATHGIVCDKDKNIWVSTNSGIISLDSLYNYRFSFDRFSGLDVLEYADGACYYDEVGDKILFGGINGLTVIDQNTSSVQDDYIPEINITGFIQNGKHLPIGPMMKNDRLKVPYSKSIFGIKFSVVDHLHISDYEFMYSIKSNKSDWTTNDKDIIYLPPLEPGKYELKIKYINRATQYESDVRVLPIHITPPLYMTWWAYCLYALFIGLTIYLAIKLYMQKYAAMQEKIRRKYSDEIIKTTSDTTNAINEELSVQLTFIIGLCQQIRQAAQNNPHVESKVNLVEYNIAKINKTLQIFNEYKGITEALISSGQTTLIPVSQTATGILELMGNSTKLRGVSMSYYIEDDITLVINKEAFLTMLYSLIYKIISTTSGEKKVVIKVGREGNGNLSIRINFSSGRKQYEEMSAGISASTGVNIEKEYDIVFCHQLIAKMNGEMDLAFDEDSGIMSVNVILPSQKIKNEKESYQNPAISENINTYNTNIALELPKNFKSDAHPDYICIISKNRDISSFLGYFLSDSYSIRSYTDNVAALEKMEQMQPIAVIYDVSSMHNTLPGFLEKIKRDKRLGQMITVVLTSSLQTTEREEYTKLGADLCISFPFNMNYLREALELRIQKQKSTAEYYRSPISTYTINEGKYIHLEDKVFIDKVFKTINENIANPDLTAPMIAELLGTSTRVMYRKLESITDKKLHQILRETRMSMAVSLLASTKHTIDEIMYKVGYNNRSTFHRNFKEIYGMTPREYREKVHDDMLNNLK